VTQLGNTNDQCPSGVQDLDSDFSSQKKFALKISVRNL